MDHVQNFKEFVLGFELKTSKYLVFFGKKESSLENLKNHYPHFEFKSLWQVHGSDLLQTRKHSENNLKADAHWTNERNTALISKSADCIPFFGYSENLGKILAVHAGWRGVQQRIIPKSLEKMGSSWDLFLGPHILKDSFEIQNDCLELLRTCSTLSGESWYANGKADLFKIVQAQINENSTWKKSLTTLLFDTVTDLRFHSHRRDKDKAGRQNSFIVLL